MDPTDTAVKCMQDCKWQIYKMLNFCNCKYVLNLLRYDGEIIVGFKLHQIQSAKKTLQVTVD